MSKLPSSVQLDTLINYVKQTAIPTQLTQQIHSLTHAAQDHGDKLAVLSQDLVQSIDSISQKMSEARDNVMLVDDISQQQQICRSTATLMRMEEVRENLARMLNSIIDTLKEREHLEDKRLRTFKTNLDNQRIALREVQHSVDASFVKLTDAAAAVRTVANELENRTQANVDAGWLGRFYGQLVASGITSAMTGVVVFVATKSGNATPQAATSR